MKIRCPKEALLSALQSAVAVVPARSPKPVLSNVKLEATRDSVVLSATDLEVGIRIEIEGVETDAPGSVLLPSGRLMAIIRIYSSGVVRFCTPRILVSRVSTSWKVQGMKAKKPLASAGLRLCTSRIFSKCSNRSRNVST